MTIKKNPDTGDHVVRVATLDGPVVWGNSSNNPAIVDDSMLERSPLEDRTSILIRNEVLRKIRKEKISKEEVADTLSIPLRHAHWLLNEPTWTIRLALRVAHLMGIHVEAEVYDYELKA